MFRFGFHRNGGGEKGRPVHHGGFLRVASPKKETGDEKRRLRHL